MRFILFLKFRDILLVILKILHALGLFHEHQRPDRDLYIDVDMAAANASGLYHHLKKACFREFKIIATVIESIG